MVLGGLLLYLLLVHVGMGESLIPKFDLGEYMCILE
jgi:hypothetical protein